MRFKASNPANETLGMSISPVFNAMGEEVIPTLKKHGLYNLDPNAWYPQQDFLNVFNDIYELELGVMLNMVTIGMRVLEDAAFPPDVDTTKKALASMDAYYKLNNRDDKGGWQTEFVTETKALCTSTTPFPQDLEYGILYALVRRFSSEGTNFMLEYQNTAMQEDSKGVNDPCVYIITLT